MLNDKCKKCRRIGQKLFLKGEKCYTPKCPLGRKPYPPGIFGKVSGKHGRRGLSEYGFQLREKQRVKFNYGLRERQFANYVKEATRKKGINVVERFFELLESRLDNVLFRLGLAESRSRARQIISHGQIMVDSRKVNIPSYQVKRGDKISLKPQSASKGIFRDLEIKLKKYNPPSWLKLDKSSKRGEILAKPRLSEEAGIEESLNKIVEFYSR